MDLGQICSSRTMMYSKRTRPYLDAQANEIDSLFIIRPPRASMLAMFSIVPQSPNKSSCPKLYALGLVSNKKSREKSWHAPALLRQQDCSQ